MKHWIRLSFTLLITLLAVSAFADGEDIFKKHIDGGMKKGKAIAQTADDMDIGYHSQDTDSEMVLINSSGDKIVRKMTGTRYEKADEGDKSLIRFLKPADVRGTGLLTFEHKDRSDDQWLFLPAKNRVKRISSDNKSGSFMGSEFSYEDMATREVEKYRYKYKRDDKFNGKDCFVVESYPTESTSGYSKLVSYIDKSNFQTLKVDFYDRKREHLKTLLMQDYKKLNGKYWRAFKMVMENVQTGKKTILQFSKYKVKAGLSETKFTKRQLQRD